MDIFDRLEEQEDLSIINYMKSLLDIKNINSICDYGCGDGRLLRKIEKVIPAGGKYTGIDNWSDAYASNKIPDDEGFYNFLNNANPDFEKFIEGNQYDLVYSKFALHHFRSPIKELKRLESLTAPGGNIVIIDMYRDCADEKKTVDNVLFFNAQMIRALKGDYHHVPYTKEETCDLLLVMDAEIIDQEVIFIETSEKEKVEYKLAMAEINREMAEKADLEDSSKNGHKILMEVLKSTLQYNLDLVNTYGVTPMNVLITTIKK